MNPPRFPVRLLLVLVLVEGCASRREAPASAGERDARRQQIALLDRRIADEEAALGLGRPPAPQAVADGEPASAAGGQMSMAPGPEMPQGVDQAPPGSPPGVPEPPAAPQSPRTRFAEPPHGSGEGACVRVCRCVGAICTAAHRICRLADGLDDAWADGRCESATRSCTSAEQRAQSRCPASCD